MLCFGMILDGRAQPTGLKQRGRDATILIVFNSYHDVVNFTLPATTAHSDEDSVWELMIDTNIPNLPEQEASLFAPGKEYGITGRSLLAFVLQSVKPQAH